MESIDDGVTLLRLPDSQIECSRNYPFTYLANAGLRGLRKYYEEAYEKNTGKRSQILYPTVLNQVIINQLVHLYKTEGFVIEEQVFESDALYQSYLKLIGVK